MNDTITIRTYQPGEPSQVCFFQYSLYKEQFHFNAMYEKEMLGEMAELYDDTNGSQLWIADQAGEIVGDIAVIRRGPHEAQLRWFGVALPMQGNGLGSRLLHTAMAFCKERGYTHVVLGTLSILKSARHLYGKHGFQRTESEPFDEWADNWPMEHETWIFDADRQTAVH